MNTDVSSAQMPESSALKPVAPEQLLSATLRHLERRRLRLLVLRGSADVVMVTIAAAAVVIGIDYIVLPELPVRWTLSFGVWSLGIGVWITRVGLPLIRPRSLRAIACDIEQRMHSREEQLHSAVNFIERPDPQVSSWMIARTIATATSLVATLDAERIFSSRRTRRRGIMSGILLVSCLASWYSPSVRSWWIRALFPTSTTVRPSQFQLKILPENTVVPRGTPLSIQVQVDPRVDHAVAELIWNDGIHEQFTLLGSERLFHLDFPAVTRAFHYRIRAGSGESAWYRVDVTDPPRLESLSMAITPPTYMGLPSRTIDSGDGDIVAGSRVTLSAHFGDAPVRAAVLVRDGQEDVPFTAIQDTIARVEFQPELTMSYGIRLIGEDGLVVTPATRWLLTVRPDAAPVVQLMWSHDRSDKIGVSGTAEVVIHAADDHGLRQLEYVIGDDRDEWERRDVLVSHSGAPRTCEVREWFDMRRLAVTKGDHVRIWVEAVDQGGLRTVSPPLLLEVTSDQSAQAAQLAAELRPLLAVIDASLKELRQAERNWSSLLRTFRSEDPAAQRGELLLLGARSAQTSIAAAAGADVIRRAGMATDLAVGPRLLDLADTLEAWGIQQSYILARIIQDASGLSATYEDIQRGRDVSDSGLHALESIRNNILHVVARLDAEVLYTDMTTAAAVVVQVAPIYRGFAAWSSGAVAPGLFCTVYEGTTLDGPIIFAGVGQPALQTVLDTGRNEQVSALWAGELFIQETGFYRFQAIVDDGARISIDGSDILPAHAWAFQAPTPYEGRQYVTQGWHPIRIRYNQASGGAEFTVRWGRDEGELGPIRSEDTRHHPDGEIDDRLIRAMIAASPAVFTAAQERVRAALTQGLQLRERIQTIALETGDEPLHDLSRESARAVTAIQEELVEMTVAPMKAPSESPLNRAQGFAVRARNFLAKSVDFSGQAGGALAIECAMLSNMSERIAALRRLRPAHSEAERDNVSRREMSAMYAIALGIQQRLQQARHNLLSTASDTQLAVEVRFSALLARQALADDVASLIHRLLAATNDEDQAFAQSIELTERLVKKCLTACVEAERTVRYAEDVGLKQQIQYLRLLVRRVNSRQVSVFERQQFERQLTYISTAFRRRANYAEAQALEGAALAMEQRGDAQPLLALLGNVSKVKQRPILAIALAKQQLISVEEQLTQFELEAGLVSMNDIREDIVASGIALHLGVTVTALFGIPHLDDVRHLAERCVQLADADSIHAQEVRDLVAALTAYEATLKTATVTPAPGNDVLELVRKAANRPELRADAQRALAAYRTQVPESVDLAGGIKDREFRADAIDQALEAESMLIQGEVRERDEFSSAEQGVADVFERISNSLANERDPELRYAAARLRTAMSAARRRSELAQASASLPGAESSQLASTAMRSALRVEQDILDVLARRSVNGTLTADERDRVAQFGRQIGEALVQQRQASAHVQRVLERRLMNRLALSEAYYGATSRADQESAPAGLLLWESSFERAQAAQAESEQLAGSGVTAAALEAQSVAIGLQRVVLAEATSGSSEEMRAIQLMVQARNFIESLIDPNESDEVRGRSFAQSAQIHNSLMRTTDATIRDADRVAQNLRHMPAIAAPSEAQRDPVDEALRAGIAALEVYPNDADNWEFVAQALARKQVETLMQASSDGGTAVAGDESALQLIDVPDTIDRTMPMPMQQDTTWMRSQGEQRARVQQEMVERFGEEYQEAIRHYFNRLNKGEQP